MTAHELLSDLKCRGIDVVVVGDRLRVTAPVGVVTPALRETIQAHKLELLSLLTPNAPAARFRYTGDHMAFGDVCAGWTPSSWAIELRRKAERCDTYRPDIAENYRRWAADIEHRLGKPVT